MPTFFTGDGTELHYVDGGPTGTIPLLFLHGWRGDAHVWAPIVERLAHKHRTISVHLRGFGDSAAAPGPYRVETFADDLSALVASLDLDPLVAIGHSMGAAVAERFAIDRPDAVEGLVLVAPVPPDALVFSPKLDAMFRGTIGSDERATAWLGKLFVDEPPKAVLALLRRAALAASDAASLESYESWTTLGFGAEAATIESPTLVFAPGGDRPNTPDVVRERVAAPLARSELRVLEGVGHYAILERPDVIAREIDRFVEEL